MCFRLTKQLTELYALVLKALAIGYCILSGLDIKWLYSILHQETRKDPTRSDDRYKGFLVVVRMAGATIANSIKHCRPTAQQGAGKIRHRCRPWFSLPVHGGRR